MLPCSSDCSLLATRLVRGSDALIYTLQEIGTELLVEKERESGRSSIRFRGGTKGPCGGLAILRLGNEFSTSEIHVLLNQLVAM